MFQLTSKLEVPADGSGILNIAACLVESFSIRCVERGGGGAGGGPGPAPPASAGQRAGVVVIIIPNFLDNNKALIKHCY